MTVHGPNGAAIQIHLWKSKMKKDTKIVHAGRDKKWTGQVVSPPVYHASTIIHDTVEDPKIRH